MRKEGQRCPRRKRVRNAGIEIHMPQDVYIYDPNVPVPKSTLRIEGVLTLTDLQKLLLSDRSGPESIVIPDSVTKIGNGAFCYCVSLKSVVIPDGVTLIGRNISQGAPVCGPS